MAALSRNISLSRGDEARNSHRNQSSEIFARQQQRLFPPLKEYSHVTFSRDLTVVPSASPQDTQSHTGSLCLTHTHTNKHTYISLLLLFLITVLPIPAVIVLSSPHPCSQQLTHSECLAHVCLVRTLCFCVCITDSWVSAEAERNFILELDFKRRLTELSGSLFSTYTSIDASLCVQILFFWRKLNCVTPVLSIITVNVVATEIRWLTNHILKT